MRHSAFAPLAASFALASGYPQLVLAQQDGAAPNVASSTAGDLRIEQLATLEFPWGMALLPDNRVLITEKPGRLRIWADGELSPPVTGAPEIAFRGTPVEQGGLLDVAVDPDFANNGLVYLSYVEAAESQPDELSETDDFRFPELDLDDDILRGGVVARARLEGHALGALEVIWRQEPKMVGRGHFGHRLVFAPDGKLFITSGDRMRFEPAQSLDSSLGKVLRINSDGSTPDDNPFVDTEGALGEIWSYGHRNVLAAVMDPQSGQLLTVEMGPLGGDELNLIRAGANYGWPLVSNGDHYVRPSAPMAITMIPGHATTDAFVAPLRSWTPVISPSGALVYSGSLFSDWHGSVLIGGLSSQALVRLVLDGGRVAVEERVAMGRRIRDLLELRDGSILAVVDDPEGALLRLTPFATAVSAR